MEPLLVFLSNPICVVSQKLHIQDRKSARSTPVPAGGTDDDDEENLFLSEEM